jgi:uncharacterized protein (TIGR03905 family)
VNKVDKKEDFYYQWMSGKKHQAQRRSRKGLHCMETHVVKYRTRGVCCTRITYEIRDGRLFNVRFQGGCHGNGQGLARLLEGMSAVEAKERLSGIACESKSTSCPDQLARSLECS